MSNPIDVKYINPFVKATITILEMLGMNGAHYGKLVLNDLNFKESTFLIQVGITGAMKGQVFLGMTNERAMDIASTMMMGMPVNTLDSMACSALGELGNMIMGNTATIFSTMGILIDITPPLSLFGKEIKLQSDIRAVGIPILIDQKEYISLYICVKDEN